MNPQIVFFALIAVTFAGCQIHKPVPVEHVYPGQQHTSIQAPNYSKPRHHKPAARKGPIPSQPEAWSPIVVDPIASTAGPTPAQEPTQPLTSYEFTPRNSQKAAAKKYTRPVAVSSSSGNTHMVKRGESLYRIAQSYGMSVQQIATLNGLRAPYNIYPNQELRVRNSASFTRPTKPSSPAKATPVKTALQWTWPATGELVGPFEAGVSNGIEIGGEPGRPIRASADGTVLYSGNEVTGYGELVIIDHGNGFMSTYAHNRKLFVKQGETVDRGQKIAEMGSSESDRTKLHFEIRKGEKPVDPLAYLPAR